MVFLSCSPVAAHRAHSQSGEKPFSCGHLKATILEAVNPSWEQTET